MKPRKVWVVEKARDGYREMFWRSGDAEFTRDIVSESVLVPCMLVPIAPKPKRRKRKFLPPETKEKP